MRRVLALDMGEARVGAAVTDPLGVFAQGIAVWRTYGWRAKFEECLAQYDPELVLVGLPRRTDGTCGPEAEKIVRLVEELRTAYPGRRFATWDERYTTVIAQRVLSEADVSREKRKGKVDKIAAALILQSWLESSRAQNN
ncbi:MAG: Holliday junction resolvase RuvX [Synergistaceae bacterium]|nr:Holliday junction resolvase RuvX [Synergistaceae bacterium]